MTDLTEWADSDPSPAYDIFEYCPSCGDVLEWEDCDVCGGEGEYDVYETDPLWYSPGDTESCHQCAGKGGWSLCTNKQCKTDETPI